jgi:hypothetical protein
MQSAVRGERSKMSSEQKKHCPTEEWMFFGRTE